MDAEARGFESHLHDKNDLIAQLVEHYTFNVGVSSSSLDGVTISFLRLVGFKASLLHGEDRWFESSRKDEETVTNS